MQTADLSMKRDQKPFSVVQISSIGRQKAVFISIVVYTAFKEKKRLYALRYLFKARNSRQNKPSAWFCLLFNAMNPDNFHLIVKINET